ncbi:hypothetical protein HDU93_006924, partial [Gonapodya sp. JEL0774]
PRDVKMPREGAILRMQTEARKKLLSVHRALDDIDECALELGFPAVPVTNHIDTLLWEDMRTPEMLREEREIQQAILPEYLYWGLGLRDAIMTDFLLDFCALISAGKAGQAAPTEAGNSISSPRAQVEGTNIVAVMGKSHVFGVTRLWSEALKSDTMGRSVLQSHHDMRRYRFFELHEGVQTIAKIADVPIRET